MQVLVVDDEAAIRRLFQDILEDLPVGVRTAGSVAEALEAVGAGRFELVISDVHLGPHSGLTLIRTLRQRAGAVPEVVLMSGAWSEGLRARARALGAETWDKPVDAGAVREAVSAMQARGSQGRG